MGSTRLPGKVLKPIAGQPLLWHIVHRLKASRLIEDIAIATTTNPLDQAIVEFGARQRCHRGARARKTMCLPGLPAPPNCSMPTSSCGFLPMRPSWMQASSII